MRGEAASRSGVQRRSLAGFTEFSRAVSDSFVPLRVSSPKRERFHGTLRSAGSSGLNMTDITASPHAVERTDELIGSGRDDAHFKLSLMLRGTGLLVQDDREIVLQPGELAIYDTSRPYSLVFDGQFRTLVVMFSRERFGLPADAVGNLTAVGLSARTGLGAVISPFLERLGDHLEQFAGPAGARLAHTTLDLITTLVAGELDSADSTAGGHRAMFAQLRRYIDQNLATPGLGPATIAAANFISARHLHAIFHEQGLTVSSWIRARRIERCHRELSDPMLAELPISTIAARWGFIDAAHFSHVFKASYGVSPTEVRARVRGD